MLSIVVLLEQGGPIKGDLLKETLKHLVPSGEYEVMMVEKQENERSLSFTELAYRGASSAIYGADQFPGAAVYIGVASATVAFGERAFPLDLAYAYMGDTISYTLLNYYVDRMAEHAARVAPRGKPKGKLSDNDKVAELSAGSGRDPFAGLVLLIDTILSGRIDEPQSGELH